MVELNDILGSPLIAELVANDHLTIWPWKHHLAVEMPFGSGKGFSRENQVFTGGGNVKTRFVHRMGA